MNHKKDYSKSKELEKQKHDLMFKLETFKNEHLSIKQTLEEGKVTIDELINELNKKRVSLNVVENIYNNYSYNINQKKI